MGILYDHSVTATIVFCVALQLAAVPIILAVRLRYAALRNAITSNAWIRTFMKCSIVFLSVTARLALRVLLSHA